MNEKQMETLEKMFPHGFILMASRGPDDEEEETTQFVACQYNPNSDPALEHLGEAFRMAMAFLEFLDQHDDMGGNVP